MYTNDFKWVVQERRSEATSKGHNWDSDFMPSVVRGLQRHASRSSIGLPEQENLTWAFVKTTGIWICL